MEYLFNRDGKKFAIVSKIIGTTQIICKEVFIEKGTDNEVLSSNVLTLDESGLFNAPVESYQEKRKKELEKTLESYQQDYNIQVDRFRKLTRGYEEINKDFLEIRNRVLKFCKDKDEPFVKLLDFITGSFEYVVVDDYDGQIMTKEEFFAYVKYSDGMRGICPLYASNKQEDRKLMLFSYSDCSGGARSEVFLFSKEKPAKDKFIEMLTKKVESKRYSYSRENIEKLLAWGIDIPKDEIKTRIENLKKDFQSNEKALLERNKSLSENIKYFESLD